MCVCGSWTIGVERKERDDGGGDEGEAEADLPMWVSVRVCGSGRKTMVMMMGVHVCIWVLDHRRTELERKTTAAATMWVSVRVCESGRRIERPWVSVRECVCGGEGSRDVRGWDWEICVCCWLCGGERRRGRRDLEKRREKVRESMREDRMRVRDSSNTCKKFMWPFDVNSVSLSIIFFHAARLIRGGVIVSEAFSIFVSSSSLTIFKAIPDPFQSLKTNGSIFKDNFNMFNVIYYFISLTIFKAIPDPFQSLNTNGSIFKVSLQT
ncbi:hypothetical protein DVH24_038005 [Malus domestica]|uniref:Uncharacterized protein n=1 Tax=Malus domestica TaxID=3750 RepID=A0A498K882_MALDO|nr:hypothetical protein DVH24_038005 [Malus domestica]